MKRRNPSQTRSLETVNRIIQALSRIIEADGYASTSTAKIAKEAGVGIATVYGYFENKEDILTSLMKMQSDEILQRLADGIPEWLQGGKETTVRTFIRFVVEEVSKHAALTKAFIVYAPLSIDNPKTVRSIAQFEVLLGMIFGKSAYSRDAIESADSFIMLNAILGLILGLANGLPESVTQDDVVKRMENLAFVFLNID